MNRRQLNATLAVLSAAVLAGCGTEPAGDYVFSPGDCDGVPFRMPGASRAAVDDWGLRYAAVCPTIAVSLDRCARLSHPDADPDGFVDCIRENVEMAPESCPDKARDAFLEAFRDSRLHRYCLADHRDRVHAAAVEALAPHADAVPPGIREAIAERCAKLDLASAATLCVDRAVERHIADTERDRAIELSLAAALDGHAAAWPSGRRDDVDAHCRSAAGPDEAAGCVAEAAGLFRAAADAVAGVAEGERGPILEACVKSRRTAHRGLGIADPDCAAENARALLALGGYAQDTVEGCRTARRPRWSQVFACARRAWLTRERVASVDRELSEAAAGLRPDFLRPAVTGRCRWSVERRTRITAKPWLEPFEHPADGIARLVGSCVDGLAGALLGIRRAAGATYAAAFEGCVRRTPKLTGNQHWPYAARCVGDAARKAGDTRFADALRACAKEGDAAAMAACPAAADG